MGMLSYLKQYIFWAATIVWPRLSQRVISPRLSGATYTAREPTVLSVLAALRIDIRGKVLLRLVKW